MASLKGNASTLAKSIEAISNPSSAANWAIDLKMKPQLASFILSNPDYMCCSADEYSDIVDDFLSSVVGKRFIAWFTRSKYNSYSGKCQLVFEVTSHA